MACPSSHVSKVLLVVFCATLSFYVYMDINLYLRIKEYPIDGEANSSYGAVSWIGCEVNPLCDVTVKAVLLDHTNYYLFAPLVTLLDDALDISHLECVTPNGISVFHVFVAALSARCVAGASLRQRRVGAVLFEVRTLLDDLDGHVARVRKHVKGERSEVGSSGYYVDGACDALGCAALLLGVFVYLKNNPPRRGYTQLPTSSGEKECKVKVAASSGKVSTTVACFAAQMVLSSLAWNRYIALYQEMLERGSGEARREEVFRSSFFFTVALLWRVVNVHNMVHCLLVGIFCDKLWEFLRSVQYVGFVVLLFVVAVTEVHVTEVRRMVEQGALANGTNF